MQGQAKQARCPCVNFSFVFLGRKLPDTSDCKNFRARVSQDERFSPFHLSSGWNSLRGDQTLNGVVVAVLALATGFLENKISH